MAPPTSVLSKTLQSITLTKIRELEKLRNSYEDRKRTILAEAEKSSLDQRGRVARLVKGVIDLDPDSANDATVTNIRQWLDQSRYDTSVSSDMLQSYEDKLRAKLEVQSRRMSLASLYSRLLTEWMNPTTFNSSSSPSPGDDQELFPETQKVRLQELCDKFESVVFEPYETNEVEIDIHLHELFDEGEGTKGLEEIRRRLKLDGNNMLLDATPFNNHTLTWCIKGLLAEDLLSDEKQSILQDFLQNDVVLGEIADVLNMRFADIKNWSWDAGEHGIPVMPRQGLNGKYRIWMDEDVLQAILIHYVGIEWCVRLKHALKQFVFHNRAWNWKEEPEMTQADMDKRQYFLALGSALRETSHLVGERKTQYTDTFFLSSLPSTPQSLYTDGGYDNENNGADNIFGNSQNKSSTKQQLLRKIAAEVLIHQHLSGKVSVVQSDLQWYATALPHSTIFAVMRFAGFPEVWIQFFKKSLEAPLNMTASSDGDESKGPRTRKRGVPMAHAPEKLIGELVLFFMDLAVNKGSGLLLYRLHDDLWLCGDPAKCAKGWKIMQEFAAVMGVEFNQHKTGSVYMVNDGEKKDPAVVATLPKGPVTIGFLILDPETGNWIIDQDQVNKHVNQLRKQLDNCDSILAWVQTWNSCIGRFFGNTFGEPAPCFGRQHVDSILHAHEKMQQSLFGSTDVNRSTLTEHLRGLISSRFGVSEIPTAFLYLPEQLGGLGLRNPFIPLLLVREILEDDPQTYIKNFLQQEKEAYELYKKTFEELGEKERRRRFKKIFLADDHDSTASAPQEIVAHPDVFMTFSDFTKNRESTSPYLHTLYTGLMSMAPQQGLQLTTEVANELEGLEGRLPDPSKEIKWIVQLYSRELFEACGGLSLVEKSFLPLGVLTMMRQKKVTWQMVL